MQGTVLKENTVACGRQAVCLLDIASDGFCTDFDEIKNALA